MVWTLRKKILMGYGLTLILTLVVMVWALVNVGNLGKASDAILRENYKSILAAENMINAIERQDSALLLLTLGYEADGLRQFKESESQFLQWLGRAKDNITIEGEGRILNAIDTGYASFQATSSRLERLHRDDPRKAILFYHETVLPAFTSVRDGCIRLRDINQETMFEASERAQGIASRAFWSMAILGSVALGIGLGFSLFLSTLVVKPLRQIMAGVQEVSDGRYDVQVSTESSDELGHLAGEFNAMVEKLKSYHNLNIEQIIAEKQKGDAILRSIDDGILVVDAEFKVVGINPTAAEIFSADSNFANERHFLEVAKNEELFAYVKQAVESGEAPPVAEGKDIFTVSRNGTQCYYQFSIAPVRARPDTMMGVVLLLRDVTKLKELDRMKSEFVMTASHELRTPLTSIGMGVALLLESALGKLDEKEQELLYAAHEDLQRLKTLVNSLLDLSRIEAGKMEMEFEHVPIHIICEKAIAVLKAQAEDKCVALSADISPDLPAVRADLNKATWVLINLISNALRYTSAGGFVRVSAEPAGSQMHVSVCDNGTGIPYEYQARIFDKFVQVNSDGKAEGSGLGLAICREICRAHGGSIWVESRPGEGSTFTFSLPAAHYAEEAV